MNVQKIQLYENTCKDCIFEFKIVVLMKFQTLFPFDALILLYASFSMSGGSGEPMWLA